ncbi:hypothetical protein PG985_014979 [Apiospora marii]|uniref:Aminoglycoside phosphotransferase domain-containing protein n=1 Tax=Apiospora marii TaxID=335849 RepID=A0ABR1RIN1_9PEZI
MGAQEWMKESIDEFFTRRQEPSQHECDQKAHALLQAKAVKPVEMQGSLSYTVIATTETIISFRVPESKLGNETESLAKYIHGDLVPQSAYHGKLGDEKNDGKNLLIYTMPYLPGKAYLEIHPFGPQLSDTALGKHVNFARHLARYFARCWLKPQSVSSEVLQEAQENLKAKLNLLKGYEKYAFLHETIAELEGENGVSYLFSKEYPQVLNHMDLSETNVLVDPESFAITGIIDWSLGAVKPFGYELCAPRRMSGVMSGAGWHDYCSREVSDSAFWDEFWHATGIKEDQERSDIKRHSLLASKLGWIMKFAFFKTLDGKPLGVRGKPTRYLSEWFGAGWSQVRPVTEPAAEDAAPRTPEVYGENAEGQKASAADLPPVVKAQDESTTDTTKG